ncbi:MAG: glycine--tRNA ligase subunit beta [Streptococcaceae bacterium]|jgi:glycyl-tRNA synthetase beta chain|nr:glycine--tRNA ligase subunit beta [Streptococcaceae bacterium]
MTNYLLEIGLEEMPAHLVTPAVEQLETRMTAFLQENRVDFTRILKFSTPRRLAVLVEGIAEKSQAMDEEVKGPAAKIAKDAEGNWSKAIQGFSRGQGVNPDDLQLKDDYYFAEKHIEGLPTCEILTKVGDEVISKMTFSTYMKWGNNDFLFIRPIQWLVSLLDTEIVPFQILDVKAGRTSRGHRFLANREVVLVDAKFYEKALQDEYVIVYAPARKFIIAEQIMKKADENNWEVELHSDLLEEVNNLVEWPTAFVGSFDPKYLELPEEVLITSMRDNQRYFEVFEAETHKLVPNFIAVRNGNEEFIENVIAGNEKVLVARLEDAKFFWEEDQKLKIDVLVDKLSAITFHAKIGSLSDHMDRTRILAAQLADVAKLSPTEKIDVLRAAEIYKFDLLTGMVNEFDELQGVMGEKYALLAGENPNVAAAIREHYLPTSADGALPVTKVGAVLAAADKLDSLISFFAAGLIPSGSNDPYALRRATAGLLHIIEAQNWNFDLAEFISSGKNADQLMDFIKGRIAKMLENEVRGDIIDAALAVDQLNVLQILDNARVIDDHKAHEAFKPAVEAVSRVINIVKKNEVTSAIDSGLFESSAETALYEFLQKTSQNWQNLTTDDKFRTIVHGFTPLISAFFEEVMVMVDDTALKNNRLALLKAVSDLTGTMADFSLILTK